MTAGTHPEPDAPRPADTDSATPASPPRFLVGVGASAGGLEALGQFFAAVERGQGTAFVVVQHLSPDHRSYMVDLLARKAQLTVQSATHGVPIESDHIYVLPPRKLLRVEPDHVVLEDLLPSRGQQMPIDVFFHSMAETWKARCVAVVLSGTGSDGTQGVRAVKDQGGMVMVQSAASAEFDGMPRSAINTGVADFIAAPGELPELLRQFVRHPLAGLQDRAMWNPDTHQSDLQRVFNILRERTGVDFTGYKANTIHRRIARRMLVQQIESLQAYGSFLGRSTQETELLFNDLLICVTSFLRDRDVWLKLEQEVVPGLLQARNAETLRAWVPGCSTGEEAYSLAMVLMETMEQTGQHRDIKIFATDISRQSLEIAAMGHYSKSALINVPIAWLERYFVANEDGYRVSQKLRRAVVFARHDLLHDPPFMRVDMVCCRNLLIYLLPAYQTKVFHTFGQSLNEDGILLLGSSETPGEQTEFLTPVSSKHRIFRRRSTPNRMPQTTSEPPPGLRPASDGSRTLRPHRALDLKVSQDMVTKELIKAFAPPCFVVNERRELLHVFGRGGEYLRHPDGALSNNVLRMTAHSIGQALGPALNKAIRDNTEFVYENVDFPHHDAHRVVKLRVIPLALPVQSERLFLVLMEESRDRPDPVPAEDFQADRGALQRIRELEQELAYTRDSLQSATEELEASNEELQASNEELIASNEELQSTNEELQSVNEELHTVNAESQRRIDEMQVLSNDLSNMFTVAQVGAILLSVDLRMRRLASAVFTLTGLTPADIGAPVEVLARQLDSEAIMPMLRRVAQLESTEELEIRARSGAYLLLRATPFLNEAGAPEGLVMTLMDISSRSRTLHQLAASETLLRSVLNALPSHVAILDTHGTITQVNEAWDRFALDNGGQPGRVYGVGASYFEACRNASGPFGDEAMQILRGMEAVNEGRQPCFEQIYPCHAPQGQRWFHLHVSRLPGPQGGLVVSHTRVRAPGNTA